VAAAHAVSLLGDTWGMVAVTGMAWWLFGRRHAHAAAAAIAISTVLWLALNGVLDLPRPDPAAGVAVHDELDIGSFPSGHTQQATAGWGMLYGRGLLPLGAAAGVVLLVALSRLYLGAHYLADVAVAVPIGLAVVILHVRYWDHLRRRFAETGWLWPAIWGVSLLAVLAVPLAGLGDDERRWEATGLIAGALMAFPAERKWVRYEPPARSLLHQCACAGMGLSGIAALFAINVLAGDRGGIAGGVMMALAGVWAWVVYPLLLQRRAVQGGPAQTGR
jgi:hypothetical protein